MTRPPLGTSALGAVVVVVATYGLASAHQSGATARSASQQDPAVEIMDVEGRTNLAFHFTPADEAWSVTRTTDRATVSLRPGDCPQILSALEELRALGDVRIGPLPLFAPRPIPIPPTVKDGTTWTVRTSAVWSDWSTAEVVTTGSQGPLALWAARTDHALSRCVPSD